MKCVVNFQRPKGTCSCNSLPDGLGVDGGVDKVMVDGSVDKVVVEGTVDKAVVEGSNISVNENHKKHFIYMRAVYHCPPHNDTGCI